MVGINNIVLVGRFVKDPEARTFRDKHYTTFTLAVERPAKPNQKEGDKPPVDFIPCVCWSEKMAALIANQGAKGALAGVIGRMTYEVKKMSDGTYKVNAGVQVNNFFLYEYRREDNMPVNTANLPEYTSNSRNYTASDDGIIDPDDLPF